MNTDSVTALKKVAIERLEWSRGFAIGVLNGLEGDHLTYRPGGKGNHALWFMGHIAATDDGIVSLMTGEPRQLPERYRELFTGRLEPSTHAADFPPREELLEAMHATRRRTLDWARGLDDTTAFLPAPDPMRRFAPDRITTAFALAAHELMHAGQITVVRSMLGLPRVIR